jgi:hypothetical protein
VSDLRRRVALLVLIGFGTAWSTPCPQGARGPDAARWVTHPVAMSALEGAEHSRHRAHVEHPAQGGAAEQSLRAPCPCGCGDLPAAAGTSAHLGDALLLARAGVPEPPDICHREVALERVLQLVPASIDHIPIAS